MDNKEQASEFGEEISRAIAILESFANPSHATFSYTKAQFVLNVFKKTLQGQGTAAMAAEEVARARAAWPPFNSAHEGYAVLLEEVDELKDEVWLNQKKRDPQRMRKEAIQVAAMAIRFADECCGEDTCRK